MTESLRLSFVTDQDKTVTMRVARANPALSALQVRNAMDNIIDSSAFDTNGRGNIVARCGADLVVTTVIHFNV